MARSAVKKERAVEIEVVEIEQTEADFFLIGSSPFICNRVAEKAKRELLFPRGTLTKAQKAAQLKHDPPQEFRDSAYTRRTNSGPTRVLMKATAIKGAVSQSAIDMPTDIARAQIDRLVYVVDEMIDIWGIPLLNMDVVRNSDIARTPDIRTRAKIFPWASRITLRFAVPMLSLQSISTLLRASGKICGIGDFRQQKGKGSNGLYEVFHEPTSEWEAIVRSGGLIEQDEAFKNIVCSDPDSEDLLEWWQSEVKRRRTPSSTRKSPAEDFPGVAPVELVAAEQKRTARRRTNGPSAA
jgi:hypothetical protein